MYTILIAPDEKKVKDLIEQLLEKEGYSIFNQKDGKGRLYKDALKALEKPLIENVLERTDGNQLKAARMLGINRNTMRSKIKKLGIDITRWK